MKLISIFRKKVWSTKGEVYSWLESAAIMSVIIALCFYFHPSDPFFLQGTFPWMWFGPVLIALRYGTLKGVFAVVIIASTWFYFRNDPLISVLLAHNYFLGGFLLTMICGEFQAIAAGQRERSLELEKYLEERLKTLAEAYYLMRLSHDRLEQNFVSLPLTINAALEKLRRLLVESHGELNQNAAANLINLLDPFCALQSAAIYIYENGIFVAEPIAYIGKKNPIFADDILIKRCLETRETSYHAVNELTEYQQSKYLLASLLVSSDNEIAGVFVVEDMSFWNLTNANIGTINLLLAYFSDDLTAANKAKDFLKEYPDCPLNFAKELHKVISLKKAAKIDSVLLIFAVQKSERNNNTILQLVEEQNNLALSWRHKSGDYEYLMVLLPLYSQKMIKDYLRRIKQSLKQELGVLLEEPEIRMNFLEIMPDKPEVNIKKLLALYEAK